MQAMDNPRDQDGYEGSTRGQREIGRVLRPDQGIVPEQHVADGAAAERGDTAEQAHADPIHAAPSGCKRRRHGLRGERHQRQRVENQIARWQIPHRDLMDDAGTYVAGSRVNRRTSQEPREGNNHCLDTNGRMEESIWRTNTFRTIPIAIRCVIRCVILCLAMICVARRKWTMTCSRTRSLLKDARAAAELRCLRSASP